MEMISEHMQGSPFTSASCQQDHLGHLCYKQMDGSPIKTTAAFIYSLQFKPFQERQVSNSREIHIKAGPQHLPGFLGGHSICVVSTSQAVAPRVGILLPGVKWGEQGHVGLSRMCMFSSAFAPELRWVAGHSWSTLPRECVRCHAGLCSALEAMCTES